MAAQADLPRTAKQNRGAFRGSVFAPVINASNLLNAAEGYLEKKGKRGFFSSRFFTAKGHYLKYCKNENVAGVEDFCLAAIDLNLVDVSDTNDTVHSGRSFEILFPDTSDKMVLRASTAEDATEWVRILKELKATPAPAADGSGAAPPPAPVEGSPSNATEDEATDEAKYMVKQARSSILVVDENLVSPLGVGDRPIAMRAQSRKAAAIEQQEVPEELKPTLGQVNQVRLDALATSAAGRERDVRKRKSITARKCWMVGCSVLHFRDSPYCHDHSSRDLESVKQQVGGTSELEDEINRAVEKKLDHAEAVSRDAIAAAETELAALPADIAAEFPLEQGGALEIAQLRQQFDALFDGNNDGTISAGELLGAASLIGDTMDPKRVNETWAQTVIAGILGAKTEDGEMKLDPAAALSFEHFLRSVTLKRNNIGTDIGSIAARAHFLEESSSPSPTASDGEVAKGDAVADPDSDEDDEGAARGSTATSEGQAGKPEGSKWMYPVVVPENAVEGTVLTIPLSGGESAYCPVPAGKEPGSIMHIPMTEVAITACVKDAAAAAAAAQNVEKDNKAAAEGGDPPPPEDAPAASKSMLGMMSSMSKSLAADEAPPRERPPLEKGQGHAFLELQGRNYFCANMFLSLREAASMRANLPALEGWMLKRGNKMAKGSMNSWKLRYFRQEGTELVYYDKKPRDGDMAEAHIKQHVSPEMEAAAQQASRKRGMTVEDALAAEQQQAAASAAEALEADDGTFTEEERAAKLANTLPTETFEDPNLKGAINLQEITNIELSLKTAVPIRASKAYFAATGDSPDSILMEAAGLTGERASAAVAGSSGAEDTENRGSSVSGGARGSTSVRIGKIRDAEYAEQMVVIKVTDAKMRRYVLAVSVNKVVSLLVAFKLHRDFAKASLGFRRQFGSGVKQGLTLGERIAYAAASPAGRVVILTACFLYENKWARKNILGFDLTCGMSPIAVTPARIVTACIITKAMSDVYYGNKYAQREAKYGIKWQWKKDAVHCALCEKKFPTTAMRKERSKHHCRMCGRVMCHACANNYLFYPSEGKNLRTCDFCIKNGGPPEECIADNSNQKSLMTLLYEKRSAMAASTKANKAKAQANANRLLMQREKDPEKLRLMELENEEAIICAALTNKPLVSGNLVDAGIKTPTSDERPNTFTIYLPPEAMPGQVLEVTNEFGDRLVTRVPHEAKIEQKNSTRPLKKSFPVVGERVVGTEEVVRKWTDVEMEYGIDGVVFIVNKDLPPLYVAAENEKE